MAECKKTTFSVREERLDIEHNKYGRTMEESERHPLRLGDYCVAMGTSHGAPICYFTPSPPYVIEEILVGLVYDQN